MAEDAVAIEQARQGDADAFGRLFQSHEPAVRRVCTRLLNDAAEAQDATSEVFLRARQRLDTFRSEEPFRPWLLGIAKHHCLDRLRRRQREIALFERAASEPAPSDAPSSPLQRALQIEERDRIHAAIDELPYAYRLPLALRYFGELDYAGIAEILGVSSGQVGSLIYRGKRLLRAALQPAADEPAPGRRRRGRRKEAS
ncbi:MAG: RNA polymerase sigma factor [Proteobacteria bacterium]|nr:RNA polymerase sigma factor [Pseudomonadota bacterium]